MKSLIIAAIFALSLPAYSCGSLEQQQEMASLLHKDKEYLQFVCGEEPCELDQFQSQLEFHGKKIAKKGNIQGCFVEPVRKARNFYTGVFLVDGMAVKQQFIYFGSGIGPVSKRTGGYKDLVGTELSGPNDFERHLFRWDGTRYTESDGNR
ncbi:hypothetical protein [Caldimonas brevitalea]|uniref:Uncharacterized protein n=1 Tax=Caldimonas brevitalea TaxID=413882 RepID=A0A0G3BU68_9BURK|nr:hypothetical protein [Caldimonas brevitalea]AKJ30906.1 hypothetical protein AAW51_4215 [Caldimonas brevitalea]